MKKPCQLHVRGLYEGRCPRAADLFFSPSVKLHLSQPAEDGVLHGEAPSSPSEKNINMSATTFNLPEPKIQKQTAIGTNVHVIVKNKIITQWKKNEGIKSKSALAPFYLFLTCFYLSGCYDIPEDQFKVFSVKTGLFLKKVNTIQYLNLECSFCYINQ